MKLIEYLKKEDEYKNIYWAEDVKRIVEVMKKRDIEVTPTEAEDIWDLYSDDCFAQWLGLPDDDEQLFNIIIEYAKRKYGIVED